MVILIIYIGNDLPMGPAKAAKMIRNMSEFHGQDIRLLSCNTGSLKNGFAQQLAKKLNVNVYAPNNYLWAFPSGKLSINGMNSAGRRARSIVGDWVKFTP